MHENAKTRIRFTNAKKLSLVTEFEKMKSKDPINYKFDFAETHPTVSYDSVRKWMKPGIRRTIATDETDANSTIRSARVSENALARYHRGFFPAQEVKVYDLFGSRRDEAKKVGTKWLQAKMRKFVNEDKDSMSDEKKKQAEKFKASTG